MQQTTAQKPIPPLARNQGVKRRRAAPSLPLGRAHFATRAKNNRRGNGTIKDAEWAIMRHPEGVRGPGVV